MFPNRSGQVVSFQLSYERFLCNWCHKKLDSEITMVFDNTVDYDLFSFSDGRSLNEGRSVGGSLSCVGVPCQDCRTNPGSRKSKSSPDCLFSFSCHVALLTHNLNHSVFSAQNVVQTTYLVGERPKLSLNRMN